MTVLGTAVVAGALAGAPGASAAGPGPEFFANGKSIGEMPESVMAYGHIAVGSTAAGQVHCFATMQGTVSNSNGIGLGEVGFATSSCEFPPIVNDECTVERNGEVFCAFECTYGAFVTQEMPLKLTSRVAEVCKEKSKSPAECPAETEREVWTVYSHYARRPGAPWTLQLTRGERREEEGVLLKLGGGLNCYPKETVLVEGKEVEAAASWEDVPAGCVKINLVYPRVPAEFVYYGSQEIWVVNGVHNGLSPSHIEFVSPSGILEGGPASGDPSSHAALTGKLALVGEPSLELLTAK